MSSVGLSFGSATSGQGIDVSTTVSNILANYQRVETPWKTQLTTFQSQDAVLSTLGTQISALTTDIQNLTDFQGAFAAKKGSSSDTNLIELSSANSTAIAGTHSVTVQNLAQTSSAASSAVGAKDTMTGSVTIQIGSGKPKTVNVGDSSTANTISGLAAAINAAGIGVTASIITDTTGSRLSVVSNTNGLAGTLTVSGTLTDTSASSSGSTSAADSSTSSSSQSVSFTQAQPGLDATLLVDGSTVTSPGNTVTGAISGVTFQLLSANKNEPVQVIIANDNASVESDLNMFVNDYNTLVKSLNSQEGNDSSGNPEPLFGNPLIAELQNALGVALYSAPENGAVKSLYSLGITANTDGTLSLNSESFDSMLNSNFSDVMGFFQNEKSFGMTFKNTLNNLGNINPSGALALTQKMNSSQEKSLNDDIAEEESRLSDMKSRLTNEFNLVNETLQQIPDQINYVNQIYDAITGYNQKS